LRYKNILSQSIIQSYSYTYKDINVTAECHTPLPLGQPSLPSIH